jgi:hypothetical protein
MSERLRMAFTHEEVARIWRDGEGLFTQPKEARVHI